ncbi:MAG: DNA-3-methyladenine glycosylase [Bacteroidales bacterium]|nr:DNA-3-methyladenine glycosylase [Bacteroidales bacterium]
MKLPKSFYLQEDVVSIARQLIGKVLYTNIDGIITAGIISETEAYEGTTDKASHAFGNRRTKRTETMFAEGGIAYVYLCYGMYELFNVVTNIKDIPHAVLIRGIIPYEGLEAMAQRRGVEKIKQKDVNGPGKLSKALSISRDLNEFDLNSDVIWIEDKGVQIDYNQIVTDKRIGINYAEEDALLPYRFFLNEK